MDLVNLIRSLAIPEEKLKEVRTRASDIKRLLEFKVPLSSMRSVEVLITPIALEITLREMNIPFERSLLIRHSAIKKKKYESTFSKWNQILSGALTATETQIKSPETDVNELNTDKITPKRMKVKKNTPPKSVKSSDSTSVIVTGEVYNSSGELVKLRDRCPPKNHVAVQKPSDELIEWRNRLPPLNYQQWCDSLMTL